VFRDSLGLPERGDGLEENEDGMDWVEDDESDDNDAMDVDVV